MTAHEYDAIEDDFLEDDGLPDDEEDAIEASNAIETSNVIETSEGVGGPSVLDLPRALYTGKFPVGDAMVECAVLEGPIRVLTQRGMFVYLGRNKNPTKGQASMDDRPAFLAADNLEPFISDRLRELWSPLPFIGQGGYRGNINFGYRAEIIPLVCSVYIDAEAAGVIKNPRQKAIAERCRRLQEAFATIGIRDLIDDATGYREFRAKDDLQMILAAYIEPEFLPWQKRFTDEFYEQMFRLWNWQYRPQIVAKPKAVAQLTSQLVYEKMPPGVIEELRRKNPADEMGRRKHRHHQALTLEVGVSHLEKHLAVVTALMKISPNKRVFMGHFNRAFPPVALPSGATQLALSPGLLQDTQGEIDDTLAARTS